MAYGTGIDTRPPLRQIAKELRGADKAYAKELGKINKAAGTIIAVDAQARAGAYGPQVQKEAAGFKASAAANNLKIIIANTASTPFAVGAAMGAKHGVSRTVTRKGTTYKMLGWNQLPAWVGNSWEVGGAGGPRAVNAAIRDHLDEVLEMHAAALVDVWDRAFAISGVF